MEIYDVMRTTFAAREFTDDPLPDAVLYRILDNARFAPSGGNRQGTHIVAVRDAALRERLGDLNVPGARRYFAQLSAGESPWNPVEPSDVPAATIADMTSTTATHRSTRGIHRALPAPLGKPTRQVSKLRRRPVEDFSTRDRFDGPPLQRKPPTTQSPARATERGCRT